MLKQIKRLYETRFSFGATAAIVTNLGLITGLRTSDHAKISIIGAMLVIAIADNISDSFGIHIYQESEGIDTQEVWLSTSINFIARILVSLTFILLVALLPLNIAVLSSVAWGLLLLGFMSYIIAKDRGMRPYKTMIEHLAVAIIVLLASNFIGELLLAKIKF